MMSDSRRSSQRRLSDLPMLKSTDVTVSDGKSQPQPYRLQLFSDCLVLLREEEIVWEPQEEKENLGRELRQQESLDYLDIDEDELYMLDSRERTVVINRPKNGYFGIAVKGGAEHDLPIIISKVFKDSAADASGSVFVGDAIAKVNQKSLVAVTHEEALEILRHCGDTVELQLKHYKSATPFLKKSYARYQKHLAESKLCQNLKSDDGWEEMKPNFLRVDGKRESNKEWIPVAKVPLLMAYVTRYIYGTDKLRPTGFEVRGLDGTKTGVVECSDVAELSEWTKCITNNVIGINSLQTKVFNNALPPHDQISYMGWVCEGFLQSNSHHWQNWHPRFFALRGCKVYVFDSPPVSNKDWDNASTTYPIYQTMFRVLKESEYVDERQNCFLIQSAQEEKDGGEGGGNGKPAARKRLVKDSLAPASASVATAASSESHYMSVETRKELIRIETAWHQALYGAVVRLGRVLFRVTYEGEEMDLSLDWTTGFTLHRSPAQFQQRRLAEDSVSEPGVAWRYKFSQLKGSSDDGRSTLTLVFQTARGLIETREMATPELQSLLFTMHAFLTAKVASVDPAFFKDLSSSTGHGLGHGLGAGAGPGSRGRSPSNPGRGGFGSGGGGSSASSFGATPHL